MIVSRFLWSTEGPKVKKITIVFIKYFNIQKPNNNECLIITLGSIVFYVKFWWAIGCLLATQDTLLTNRPQKWK